MSPIEVIPGLFIGNIVDCMNYTTCQQYDFLINCTDDIDFLSNKLENQTQIRIPIASIDTSREQLVFFRHIMGGIMKRIDTFLENHKTILVFCFHGQQRSPSFVSAYLMYKFKWNFDTAKIFLMSKKNDAFPGNRSFFDKALEMFEDYLNNRSRISPFSLVCDRPFD